MRVHISFIACIDEEGSRRFNNKDQVRAPQLAHLPSGYFELRVVKYFMFEARIVNVSLYIDRVCCVLTRTLRIAVGWVYLEEAYARTP